MSPVGENRTICVHTMKQVVHAFDIKATMSAVPVADNKLTCGTVSNKIG